MKWKDYGQGGQVQRTWQGTTSRVGLLVLDDLADSEGDVRRPSSSRLDALTEISVFVPKHENLASLCSSGEIF